MHRAEKPRTEPPAVAQRIQRLNELIPLISRRGPGVDECAQPLEGEIRFSERDRKRFPAGFEKEIGKIAAERGGSLRLGDNAAIDNGFILAYGGVEENCTFRAMFDSRKEALQDAARKVLFS